MIWASASRSLIDPPQPFCSSAGRQKYLESGQRRFRPLCRLRPYQLPHTLGLSQIETSVQKRSECEFTCQPPSLSSNMRNQDRPHSPASCPHPAVLTAPHPPSTGAIPVCCTPPPHGYAPRPHPLQCRSVARAWAELEPEPSHVRIRDGGGAGWGWEWDGSERTCHLALTSSTVLSPSVTSTTLP